MNIIITYALVGGGHFKAAEAVYDYLKKNYPQTKIILVDILEKSNCLYRLIYKFGYAFLIEQTPFLWKWAFHITNFRPLHSLIRPIALFINLVNTAGFMRFLAEENPDFIVSTHFLTSELAAFQKNNQKIKSKLITCITDFTVHLFWISKGTDLYIAASEYTKGQLARYGIPEENIRAFGIPIDAKFSDQHDRSQICEKIGIEIDKFTVLIMTGSFGIGPIEEIVDLLYQDIQLLVVCARNKRLFARLNNKNLKNVKVFGFIDNIHELMAVCDCIITKAGGSTISEVLAMELVPLFISVIPGQEAGNVRVLRNFSIGLSPGKPSQIREILLDLKNNPQKLNYIKDRIKERKKPYAAREIADVVCQDSFGPAG